MTRIALISAKHSPGVTTLALSIASARVGDERTLVVEADPAGGDLAARLGLSMVPGLVTAAAAGRHGLDPTLLDAHVQVCTGGFEVLVAPPSAEQSTAALERLGDRLSDGLDQSRLVVIDLGRWSSRSPVTPLLGMVDVIVVVLRPTVEGVALTQSMLASLPPVTATVHAAVVGQSPYQTDDVVQALAPAPVQLIDVDRHAAQLVGTESSQRRWLRRSPLIRRRERPAQQRRGSACTGLDEPTSTADGLVCTGFNQR